MCASCDMGDRPSDEEYYDTSHNEKMDPEVKRLWIEALRSDEYKQGKSALRQILKSLARKRHKGLKAQRFCCLGVICDLYQKHTGKGKWTAPSNPKDDNNFSFLPEFGEPENGMPPREVYEWAKLPDVVFLDKKDSYKYNYDPEDASYDSDYRPDNTFYFAAQNDAGRTFKTIANVIEKYL